MEPEPMLLNDADIVAKLRLTEDNFTERKVVSDLKDVLKTLVAFANSTPEGGVSILYVGVRDDGSIEEPARSDFDKIQKGTINDALGKSYPRVYCESRVIEHEGRSFMAILVPFSRLRPHFAGPAYVRHLSKSVDASDEQFGTLIAERTSKVYELRKWVGKDVSKSTVRLVNSGENGHFPERLVDCNEFYVTLREHSRAAAYSVPIEDVTISFDHKENRLHLRLRLY